MVNKINLDKQTYEVPNSRKPGQTGIYRNAVRTELVERFSPKVHTMYDIFQHGYKISKDRPCLGHRSVNASGKHGPYVWETYRQVNHRIINFGSGLMNLINHTLNDPRTKSIPLGIWSVNRPEWFITDMACAAYSMFTVALYDTLGPDAVEYVVNHSELEIVVCSGDHIADLLKIKEKLPKLKAIISLDSIDDGVKVVPGSVSKSAIIKAWADEKNVLLTDMATLEAAGKKNRRSINLPQPDDLACLMYTSGTTGNPKGAMLSHRNFVSAVSGSYYNVDGSPDDVSISFLPLAHIFGKVTDTLAIAFGSRIGYFAGDMTTLVDDIQELKPTFMAAVPRLLNRIYAKIAASTINAPGMVGALARRGVAVKLENLANQKGFTHPVWDRLLFNKVKQALGGNMRVMVTGSAPIGKDIMQFLRIALCCDIREGYGATETTAATASHYEGEYQAGHLGAPFPSNEIKLVDVPEMNYLSTDPYPRGEICVRGPNVFLGYFKEEEKTREAIDEEGWFHTGDIGVINERGCLVIIDRKKNIFKLAQGEYIAPEKIENVYAKDALVAQVFVHGDSLQSSLVAILVPDPEALPAFVAAKSPKLGKQNLSYAELCKHPEVNKLVLNQLTNVGKKAGLHGFELAKAFYLETEPFSMENDLLTPTFKVKRPQAKKRYEAEIAAMYESLSNQPEKAKL
ncbi:uncharacterized protein BX664DRAFT_287488 [Halteromyces radiatus]|uniref:uncharacterized protein n=1 Tax=Halteromyces radiatus TaxID=101107 RepID=UPI002220F136|nr:uncharacterized protein BX664DRAFT_287488 [Halteromyces radiatus]KAI8077880.1 hypothetical protein BX664DRAFT_287488 [Halteromyces radiatus]